ncbi:hypothetical protein UFOVP997_9 [uncultured Caudovirales phage]|uniref:Uncharacterized protein n=1 Tax=uncultured Caudovirales phage TaxID=2100421 RepID=A0A6J5S1M6_9CAUD|nr:hypothetical protein UFOVP486_11 [uncultured Caudovirales phage]CAB4170340.1 hypothetical protein UFOVP911_43 [uncultured Caudovirales phage]CAB4177262.1 hypothetical protein UFOVP997_9 [uncultured Caudovirales phage]CAB4183139.1 hypothetical protein UFOVP1088_40 [uncultured Caudovirales phage]CAB4186424.1 hypothetical protein UFOVP1149_23 [uncultured Caudovirales phage]
MTRKHYTNRQLIRYSILDLIADFQHAYQYDPERAEVARERIGSYFKARHTLEINQWGQPIFTTQPTQGDK